MYNDIDKFVGKKIKERRLSMGITQEELGNVIGVSFQQIQKYEKGVNRAGASRLYDLARALRVSVAFFFDSFDTPNFEYKASDSSHFDDYDVTYTKDSRKLTKYFNMIDDESLRKTIISHIRAIAKTTSK